jgi:hypothetical protein
MGSWYYFEPSLRMSEVALLTLPLLPLGLLDAFKDIPGVQNVSTDVKTH